MGFASIAKWVLILFNCVFFVVGAALLAVGLYVLFTPYSFDILAVLDNGIIQAGVYGIITIGAFIFIIAALGMFGTCCKSKILLGLYVIILFLIIAAQVALCAVVIAYRSQVDSFVTSQLESTMDNYVIENGTDSYSVGWNSMQIFFECCGTNNYTDWSDTPWRDSTTVHKYQSGAQYPISCCAVQSSTVVLTGMIELDAFTNVDKCYGVGESIPNIYIAGSGAGCFESFEEYIVSNSILIGGVGIGLAAFEIILFIFALVVCFTIDKEEEVV